MAVPVLIVVAGVALASLLLAGALGLAVYRLVKFLSGKRLAILGGQGVGKTTLFSTLRDGKTPKATRETVDSEPGATFILEVAGRSVHFDIPRDLRGNDGVGFPEWKKSFLDADYVLYIFRSDKVLAGDAKTLEEMERHFLLMKGWLDRAKNSPSKIVLIGTFADQSGPYSGKRSELHQAVAETQLVKAALVKLNNAGLVVGSLVNTRSATAVVKGIRERLS